MATLKVTNIKNESFAGDQLYLKTDGTIGIGTTSPGTLLHLSAANPVLRFQDSDGTNQLTEISNAGGHTYIKSRNNTSGGNLYINTWDNGNSNYPTLFTILNGGNVGIGTTSPGTKLEIADSTASSDLVLLTLNASVGAGNSTCSLRFEGNSGTSSVTEIKHKTNGSLVLRTYGGGQLNDVLTVDSNKKIGINVTSPTDYYAQDLVILAPTNGGITIASAATDHSSIICFADGTSGAAQYTGYINYNHNTNDMDFRVNDGAKGISIKSDGDVSITDGDLIIGTAGHGIDFSAQTASSATGATTGDEVLDHYEEGTFTPYIDREFGNSPILGYTAQDGYYTRIGRVVHFYMEIRVSSYNGNGSYGTTFLRGLPFNAAARTGGRGGWDSVILHTYNTGVTTTDGEVDIAVVGASTEKVELYIMRNEDVWADIPAPDANDQYKVGGYYFV